VDVKNLAGKILIVAGFVFLTVALLFIGLNPLDQWVFAGSLFLGAILMVSGAVTLVVLLSSDFWSSDGLASLLLITASALVALSVISLFFGAHVIELSYVPHAGGGGPNRIVLEIDRPNAWLFTPLTVTAFSVVAISLLILWRKHIGFGI